jgi:hypothetical protein
MGDGLNRAGQTGASRAFLKRRVGQRQQTLAVTAGNDYQGRLSLFAAESCSISTGARLRVYITVVRLRPNVPRFECDGITEGSKRCLMNAALCWVLGRDDRFLGVLGLKRERGHSEARLGKLEMSRPSECPLTGPIVLVRRGTGRLPKGRGRAHRRRPCTLHPRPGVWSKPPAVSPPVRSCRPSAWQFSR